MNARIFTRLFVAIMVMWSGIVSAQFDDLYYDYKKDKKIIQSRVSVDDSVQDNEYVEESEYDDDALENYDDYTYATRINRFHRPVAQNMNYNNFNNWWYNDYGYDPYFNNGFSNWNYNSGVNIFIGSSWNRWNRPWGMNSWNSGFGGFNAWNSPWAWNSWNSCPQLGWGNNFYGNSFYGNSFYGNTMNNGGWNNSNDFKSKSYGSRKGGSLTSAVAGRDASPRREIVRA